VDGGVGAAGGVVGIRVRRLPVLPGMKAYRIVPVLLLALAVLVLVSACGGKGGGY